MQVRLGQLRRRGKHVIELDRVGQVEQPENPQRKAEVTHAVDDKCLDRRRIGRGFLVVEPDQQVRSDPHPFPAEEHLHQIVGGDQRQHGKGEERQIGEEARPIVLLMRPVVVMGHVAHRVKVNQRRNRVDHNQHDRRQPVKPDAPVGRERPRLDPAQDGDVLCCAVKGQEDVPRQDRAQKHEARCNDLPGLLADQAPAEAADKGAHKGREEDDFLHGFSLSSHSRLRRRWCRGCGRTPQGSPDQSPPRPPRRSG